LSVLRLRPEALSWREVGGELVAVDTQTSTYLAANPTGLLLWRALADGTTEEQLAAGLVERFGIEPDRAAADVARFVESVRARGLLAA
jgi:Coenzyme PQQ synthesis protein D (PqqD)